MKLLKKIEKLKSYIRTELMNDIGNEAVEVFKENFQEEGFKDTNIKKWKPALRKTAVAGKKASSTRKTLTGDTGDLGRSINYELKSGGIVISSDKVYAKIHNEGGKAGRNKAVTIPKRQFIGKSEEVRKRANKVITNKFNQIMKQ